MLNPIGYMDRPPREFRVSDHASRRLRAASVSRTLADDTQAYILPA
ncbi:MAG: hypothetical protein JWN71_2190 [Xanthobacteraceae bacterium]|nr:hypothetical protein [Xanthobacteraceae bacterium]